MNQLHYQTVTFKINQAAADRLNDVNSLERLLYQLAKLAGLRVLAQTQYQFQPQGHSLAIILAESHLALHTWPEYQRGYITLTSCCQLTQAMLIAMQQLICEQLVASEVNYLEQQI